MKSENSSHSRVTSEELSEPETDFTETNQSNFEVFLSLIEDILFSFSLREQQLTLPRRVQFLNPPSFDLLFGSFIYFSFKLAFASFGIFSLNEISEKLVIP